MSKENKFNPGIYTQAGRLAPDDHARERKKQQTGSRTKPSAPAAKAGKRRKAR